MDLTERQLRLEREWMLRDALRCAVNGDLADARRILALYALKQDLVPATMLGESSGLSQPGDSLTVTLTLPHDQYLVTEVEFVPPDAQIGEFTVNHTMLVHRGYSGTDVWHRASDTSRRLKMFRIDWGQQVYAVMRHSRKATLGFRLWGVRLER